ncbi:MAG: hypothetical protein IKD31_07540 [Clostridia bacterium]|nr:hypothetical protein [Clostridia bacterium]
MKSVYHAFVFFVKFFLKKKKIAKEIQGFLENTEEIFVFQSFSEKGMVLSLAAYTPKNGKEE